MTKIRVDVDELYDKVSAMREDDCSVAELEIIEDDYSSELQLSAVILDEDTPISYGSICQTDIEMF